MICTENDDLGVDFDEEILDDLGEDDSEDLI